MSITSIRERLSRQIIGPIEPYLYQLVCLVISSMYYADGQIIYTDPDPPDDEREIGRLEASCKHAVRLVLIALWIILAFCVINALIIGQTTGAAILAALMIVFYTLSLASIRGLEAPQIECINRERGQR